MRLVRGADPFGGAAAGLAAEADAAERLLRDPQWIAGLVRVAVSTLAADPTAQPPFKASRDPARTGLVLFDDGRVQVTAVLLSAHALAAVPAPISVIVTGRLAVTRYHRAGGAMISRWKADAAAPTLSAAAAPPAREIERRSLGDGEVLRIDGREAGVVLLPGTGDILTITVSFVEGAAPFMREYARDGGRLLRIATLDGGAARGEMLLALLRASGRSDAGHCFDAASRDPAFFLRWSAMREWLALDVRAAWPRLEEMAAWDPHPEVRTAARATCAMLGEELCPA